jgi:hypothetical protein
MAAKAAHHGDASAGGADAAAIPCYRPIMGPASCYRPIMAPASPSVVNAAKVASSIAATTDWGTNLRIAFDLARIVCSSLTAEKFDELECQIRGLVYPAKGLTSNPTSSAIGDGPALSNTKRADTFSMIPGEKGKKAYLSKLGESAKSVSTSKPRLASPAPSSAAPDSDIEDNPLEFGDGRIEEKDFASFQIDLDDYLLLIVESW